jgi:hypothetical protein
MENFNGNECKAEKELKMARTKKTEISAIPFYNISFSRQSVYINSETTTIKVA